MISNAALPIVDVSDIKSASTAQAMQHALTGSGFMYVTGHGIDTKLIESAFAASQRFFALPYDAKQQFSYADIASNFGFQGVAAEMLDPGNLPDLKEAFTMRNALSVAQQTQRWPDNEFRNVALAFYAAGLSAAYRIMNVMAACLKLPQDFFTVRFKTTWGDWKSAMHKADGAPRCRWTIVWWLIPAI